MSDNNKGNTTPYSPLAYASIELHKLIDSETRKYIDKLRADYQEHVNNLTADVADKARHIDNLTKKVDELEAYKTVSDYVDKAEYLSKLDGAGDTKYAVIVMEEKEGRYGDYGTEVHRGSACYLFDSYIKALDEVKKVEAGRKDFIKSLNRCEIPEKCKRYAILIPYTSALGINLDKMIDAFSFYET